MPDSDFPAALRALHEGGVEFAIVGSLAAVLHGAPVNTFDWISFPRVMRQMLRSFCACSIRWMASIECHLSGGKPEASHLRSPCHHNLITNCGPLDVLGTRQRIGV
jgi:hypothetical protein